MKIRLALFAAAVFVPAAAIAGLALAPTRGEDIEARIARLEPHVEIAMPGTASVPAASVILFSGCGGVRQVQQDYAEAANDAGIAAIIVDSHAARGYGRLAARLLVCSGLRLRGQDRAGDVFAALEMVRADPRLDHGRIALAGWSHGGWALLDALTYAQDAAAPPGLESLPVQPLDGVRAVLLIYPYCGAIIRADDHDLPGTIPIRAWLVEKDLVADPDDCKALFEAHEAEGTTIDWTLYPGLTHAFDAPDQPWDPRMEYNARAAGEAHDRFRDWLVARLQPETGLAEGEGAH